MLAKTILYVHTYTYMYTYVCTYGWWLEEGCWHDSYCSCSTLLCMLGLILAMTHTIHMCTYTLYMYVCTYQITCVSDTLTTNMCNDCQPAGEHCCCKSSSLSSVISAFSTPSSLTCYPSTLPATLSLYLPALSFIQDSRTVFLSATVRLKPSPVVPFTARERREREDYRYQIRKRRELNINYM